MVLFCYCASSLNNVFLSAHRRPDPTAPRSHLPSSTLHHPHTLRNHPQAWPVSGSQSKFKLQQGQLLLQPLWAPVISLPRGFFCQRPSARRRGLWLRVRETVRGREGQEGGKVGERKERTRDQQVWNSGGPSRRGDTTSLNLGLFRTKTKFHRTGSFPPGRSEDGGQRRRQAGHHE